MNNTAKIIIAVLVVLVVGLGYRALQPQRFGGTTNFNDLSVDTITTATTTISGAISASSTLAVQGNVQNRASTTLGTVGNAFNGIFCATQNLNFRSMAANTTDTLSFNGITGISTSSNQAWFFTLQASSSAPGRDLQVFGVVASTTPNGADVTVINRSLAAFDPGIMAGTFCYLQVQ